MEIRRSLGRFMSIFFIVAIGCAFFSGIRASEPDMRYSGDAYFDDKNMMDIEVISTMGLTDDDLQAIEDAGGVAAVEGSYSVDVLCSEGDNQIAIKSKNEEKPIRDPVNPNMEPCIKPVTKPPTADPIKPEINTLR